MKRSAAVILSVFFLFAASIPAATAAEGDPDTTFGTSGIVTWSDGADVDYEDQVVLLEDGKILLSGSSRRALRGFASNLLLARFESDGTLDTTFGTNGFINDHPIYKDGYHFAVQDDGKIVLAGESVNSQGESQGEILRYNSNGLLDTSFGTSGSVIYKVDTAFIHVVIQPDGKILVLGDTYDPSTEGIFINRYTSDGTIDNSFGSGGTATYSSFGSSISCWSEDMQTDSDGRILVAVTCKEPDDAYLVRYNSNGTLDTTFGTHGVVSYNDIWADNVFPLSNGKILLIGDGMTVATGDAALIRYNSDGSIDNSFGTDGIVTYTDDRNYDSCWGDGGTLQPDGKIYVLGSCKSSTSNTEGSFLLRYNSDGSPDTSFGQDGLIQYNGESDGSIVRLPDGRILLAGDDPSGITLKRFLGPIAADYDGDGDGTADADESDVASLYSAGSCAVTLKANGSGETITAVNPLPEPASGPNGNTTFPYGLFSFKVNSVSSGQGTTVTIYLPTDTTVNAYYMYGPTSDNASDHWYKFSYDGETGAQISGHTVTLHFVDGKRGDDDLTADGIITDAGGPAVDPGGISSGSSSGGGGGGGGGCALNRNVTIGPDLIFLLLPLLLIFLAKRRA